ncbi:uncharacterized protein SPPG_07853 [Spizellomyces punctatus DAOM BR117]|uniref:Striatin N-terminal domain-containing protein n=1 Tax=Spizellomyces punctatus (strain DAOM BR117) TaxID=645134 RepID=A0A0L0H569_SPIPD|nr:uncharacterized protein SPPG_07853 [Spizellomyces punctatus DAOM BR117]KNC96640.1 hypothetical protein SPPG_07853 [Spizellomyces punctatus DAOM BR117]|eukprot:XP_016604680.1 hypothetical protein SPPG_07853 [Spizellomyces punctatus DAOM BR117]
MSGSAAQQASRGSAGISQGTTVLNDSNGSATGVATYTLPGVLHFLQVEWRKFERERNEWEIERADLKARIALLEGERRGMENLRTDLMRRVKMLEYALRQERNKFTKLRQEKQTVSPSSEDAVAAATQPNAVTSGMSAPTENVPTLPEAVLSAPSNYGTLNFSGGGMGTLLNFSKGYGHVRSKEILKNYLREMSYLLTTSTTGGNVSPSVNPKTAASGNEDPSGLESTADPEALGRVIGKREAARARGTLPTARQFAAAASEESASEVIQGEPQRVITKIKRETPAAAEHTEGSKVPKVDTSPPEAQENAPNDARIQSPEEAVEGKEPAVKSLVDKASNQDSKKPKDKQGQERKESRVNDGRLTPDEMQELKLTPEKVSKVMSRLEGKGAHAKRKSPAEAKPGGIPSVVANTLSLDGGLATLTLNEDDVDEGAKKKGSAKPANQKIWRPKAVLRNHMDSIRAVAFSTNDGALVTASEDNTAKLWNIGKLEDRSKMLPELEPVYTFRGHTEPLTSLAVSADGQTCYTGSVDATIRVWRIPPLTRDPYASYQNTKQFKLHTYVGHSDVVWDMKLHPLQQQCPWLASVSSDGALKIWNTTPGHWQLRSTLWYENANRGGTNDVVKEAESSGLQNPTSVDWVYTNLNRIAVSYQNSIVKIFDAETGQETLQCRHDGTFDNTTSGQINKVVCHPTLPLLITAHEDRYIRIFDTNTGQCAHSMVAHQDSVSALDISPDGLTLVSGGHDCSIRWWDLTTRKCVQEYTSHRKKNDEGIWAVNFHPEASNCMASAGADAVCKLYSFGTA